MPPGTANGHKDLPRSFEERLAEGMLDEGLSPKNPARGVRDVGSENEDSGAQLRDSVRRRAEGPHTKRAFERLPSSDAQGAPDFADLQGKPSQKNFQTRVGASDLSARVPGRQQHVGSWASGMSEIDAVKLINSIKFEDVAAMSTPLGPDSIQVWSRDFGAFLVQNSAIAIVVHNDEEEQSEIWFGDVLASTSCTSMEGVRQAVELGVAELGERPRITLRDPHDRTGARLRNICVQKINKLDALVVKVIMDNLSNDPSVSFPGGFRTAVQERLESEQLEHFDDPELSSKFKTSHHVLRTAMQMLAVFATQARIALEDKLRNESMRLENPTEVTAFAQRARRLCMALVAMGVPATTVSGLLQQSIMRQPLLSVAGFELRRDVAQKGATLALPELLARVTELARTITLMGAMAEKGLGQSLTGSEAMALQIGLEQKAGHRRHNSGDKKEKLQLP